MNNIAEQHDNKGHGKDIKEIIDKAMKKEWDKYNGGLDRIVTGELVDFSLKQNILNNNILSRGVETLEELDELAFLFKRKLPEKKNASGHPYFVHFVDFGCWELASYYGLPAKEKELQEKEFSVYSSFTDADAPYKPELRILPDHPRKTEVISKFILVYDRRNKLEQKNKVNSFGRSVSVLPGFDEWRAAVAFANYSHMWSNQTNHYKWESVYIASLNAKRYQRCKLTSLEAVKAVTPGALFQVENVFGDFAAHYISGDLERFRELSPSQTAV